MPIRSRLLHVLRLALGGPANASIWNWWGLVIWLASVTLNVFGTKIPHVHLSHAAWIAVFLAITAFLLGRAAVGLHREAHPDFPLHSVKLGRGWSLDTPASHGGGKLMIFSIDFTNRQPAPVHITADLWWVLERKFTRKRRLRRDTLRAEALGPYEASAYTGTLGTNAVFGRPQVVAGFGREEGLLAFESNMLVGLTVGDDGEFIVRDGLRLFIRLRDGVTCAESDDYEVTLWGAQP